jgi:hypothetical protein
MTTHTRREREATELDRGPLAGEELRRIDAYWRAARSVLARR